MTEYIRARDLMRTEFVRIGVEQTLGDALTALLATHRQAKLPSALMVVDAAGHYQGVLTARLLIRLLVGGQGPNTFAGAAAGTSGQGSELSPTAELEMLAVARERLTVLVGDSLIANMPVVAPEDRLLTMIRRGATMRLDFLPVVELDTPVGFVPVTAIFQAAAGMALTPEDEGVRFDR